MITELNVLLAVSNLRVCTAVFRCGMMHVRAAPPPASQWGTDEKGKTLVAQKFVTDFIAGFNNRLETALMNETSLNDSELDSLGRKDPEK